MHHKITVQDDETGPHPTDEGLSVSCLVVNWYVQSNGVLYVRNDNDQIQLNTISDLLNASYLSRGQVEG